MRSASKSRGVAKILVRPALWFCACNLLAAALAAQCTSPTQVPDGTYTSGDHSVTDNNALSAANFVLGGSATATLVAGNCIQLLPGFHASAIGATVPTTFHAWVDMAPAAVSVSPTSGNGLSGPFTWTVSSPSGHGNLSHVFALFNTTSGSTVNACYIHYDPGSNLLYLADNASANWLGGFVPGSSGSASNSQCSIYGSGSSFSTSGTQLTLTVPVTFQASFSGTKNEYLFALDNTGLYTGWQQMGTWTVPVPTEPITVTTNLSGLSFLADGVAYPSPQTFQWLPASNHTIGVSSPQSGGPGTQYVFANWSDSLGAAHTITVPSSSATYTASFTTQYYLTTSAGTGGTISPPSGWYNAGSSVAVTATANAGYQFSGFSGTTTSTTNPLNLTMNGPSTLTASFIFALPAVNVTPSAGAGASQILTAAYIDPVSYGQITEALLLVNSSAATASACYVRWTPGNHFYLRNDTDSAWLDGTTASVQNSRCRLDAPANGAQGSGQTLTVNFGLTFFSAFAGAKNVYLTTTTALGTAPWQQKGTWTVDMTSGDYTVTTRTPNATTTQLGTVQYQYDVRAIGGIDGSSVRVRTSGGVSIPSTPNCLASWDQASGWDPATRTGTVTLWIQASSVCGGGYTFTYTPQITWESGGGSGVSKTTTDTTLTCCTSAPISITITPTSTTLRAGQSATFTAAVRGSANTGVTWDNPSIGTFALSDANLIYTAPASISSMQYVVITVHSSQDYTKAASATITLQPPAVTDLNSMALLSLFVERHSYLAATAGSGTNGLYDLSASDAATLDSLVASTKQSLDQIKSQASSYSNGYAYLSDRSGALQNFSAQLQSRVSQASKVNQFMNDVLKRQMAAVSLNAASPAGSPALNGNKCDPTAFNCLFMSSEIDFYNNGGKDYGLGQRIDSWVEGQDASKFTTIVHQFKSTATPDGGGPSVWTPAGDLSNLAGADACGCHTDFNPKRGTYMIEANHWFDEIWLDLLGTRHEVDILDSNNGYVPGNNPPSPATRFFNPANNYDNYQTRVDLTLKINGVETPYTNGQTATITGCSAPITVELNFVPPLPENSLAPPITWTGGTPVDNLHRTVPCVAGSTSVKAAFGNASFQAAHPDNLQTTVTVGVEPALTMDKSKIVTGTGSQVVVTASSTIAGNGAYSWEILATQPGDNPAIASLPPSPNPCGGWSSCAVTVTAGAAGGKATLRAHFRVGTTDVTADTRIIVVQFTTLRLTVANNLDNGTTSKSSATPIPNDVLQWPSCPTLPCIGENVFWAMPNPVVLVRGTVPSVALTAATVPPADDPDVNMAFWVSRAPDDAVSNVRPSLAPSGPATATLSLDQTGTFQVLAYIDTNSNGQWDPGEPGLTMPVILVQATLNRNLSRIPHPGNVFYTKISEGATPWTQSSVAAGYGATCSLGIVDDCAVQLSAEVDLVGGGTDGKRGVDRVFGGWVQDLSTLAGLSGTYQNSHFNTQVFASNVPPPPHWPSTFFPMGAYSPNGPDPDPQIINGPLLDSLNPAPGVGGNSSLGSWSQYQDAAAVPPLGKRKLVTFTDATAQAFFAFHPIDMSSQLTTIQHNLQFQSVLTLWTSAGGVMDPATGTPLPGAPGTLMADRTYGVILAQPWNIGSIFSVDAQGNGTIGANAGVLIYLGAPSCAPPGCVVSPPAGTGVVLTAPVQCQGPGGPASPCTAQNARGSNYKH